MGLNSIGKLFMPKNTIFYELFEDVAKTVEAMGKALNQLVNESDVDKRAAIAKTIEDLEHRNDDHTHKLFTELGRNFITPFDREDIHYLASALDDICDYIYSSSKKINFYRVNPNDTGIIKMAELIQQGCEQTAVAVMGLRNMKNLRAMTEAMVKINSIENQA
ncbi:MAG: DUF47 family protein, partial [Bacteroidetes bacterium]